MKHCGLPGKKNFLLNVIGAALGVILVAALGTYFVAVVMMCLRG